MGQASDHVFVSAANERRLIEAARDESPVTGLTHNYYKYPARFSPSFVRAAIEALSKPGHLVLDPFVGGGTTMVEALALGRNAIGVDISSLAQFVSTVKTTLYSNADLERLRKWASRLPARLDVQKPGVRFHDHAASGYYKHLDHPVRWRFRNLIEQALVSASRLPAAKLEAFARCVVLRTAQWALDGRKALPSVGAFKAALHINALDMIESACEFAEQVRSHRARPIAKCLNASVAGLDRNPIFKRHGRPSLIVTSPPYPGVHVLYHRWQVDGRKEAPAPFWIANKLDGAGSSYYTMGDRKYPELKTYFDSLRLAMKSLAAISLSETVIVQMIAFSDPSWQLARYLEVMDEAGFRELFLSTLRSHSDGRLWRTVPSRRWYSDQRGQTPGSEEVVLIHRKVPDDASQLPLPVRQKTRRRPSLADRAMLAKA